MTTKTYQYAITNKQMIIKMPVYFVYCSLGTDGKPLRVIKTQKTTADAEASFQKLLNAQGANTVTEEEYFTAAYCDLDHGADCRLVAG